MKFFLSLVLAVMIAAPGSFAQSYGGSSSPILIELFTSESCPYCPEADEILGQLRTMDNVIAVACHVNYFQKEKYNLARPFCKDRQEDYVRRFTGQKGGALRVYTPQLIMNGKHEMIGYETGKINMGLLKARGDKVGDIVINKGEGLVYNITLPDVETGGAAVSLWMMMIDQDKDIPGGRVSTFHNPAGLYQELGAWDGSAQVKRQPLMVGGSRKSFIIAAQKDGGGEILALGRYRFE